MSECSYDNNALKDYFGWVLIAEARRVMHYLSLSKMELYKMIKVECKDQLYSVMHFKPFGKFPVYSYGLCCVFLKIYMPTSKEADYDA